MDGFKIHREHLKKMVGLRGGLDKLGYDGSVKNFLLQWDASWQLSTGESLWEEERGRKAPVYSTLPLNDSHCALTRNLPAGFQDFCNSQPVTVDFLHVLARMQQAMTFNVSRDIPFDVKSGHRDDYLDMANLQDFRKLDDSPKDAPRLQEALLTLGVILFSATAFNEMRAIPTVFRGPRDGLTERLLKSSPPAIHDDAQDQCYQWIWAVAIDSWRGATRELLPTGQELLVKYHDRYSSRWEHPDDLVRTLKQFWWTQDLVQFHRYQLKEYQQRHAQIIHEA
jgi:hypothetical protein